MAPKTFLSFEQLEKLVHYNKEKVFKNISLVLDNINPDEILDVIKFLLSKGFDIHTFNDHVILRASGGGNMELVKFLFRKFDPKSFNQNALICASGNGHLEVVKLLIQHGFSMSFTNDESLKLASKNGHIEVVKFLLKQLSGGLMILNDVALNLACKNGHLEVVKVLLENGLRTAPSLTYASVNGHSEIVKLLLQNGSDVHYLDDLALRRSSKNGHLEVVKLLLRNGSDVHVIDDDALRSASEEGHLEIVSVLLKNNSNIHARDDEALKLACKHNHFEVVKLLLNHGANVQSSHDWPLKYAFKNNKDLFQLLLKHVKKIDSIDTILRLKMFDTIDQYIEFIDENHDEGVKVEENDKLVLYQNGSYKKIDPLPKQDITKEIVETNNINKTQNKVFIWACQNNKLKILEKLNGIKFSEDVLCEGLIKCVENDFSEIFKYIVENNGIESIRLKLIEFILEKSDKETFMDILYEIESEHKVLLVTLSNDIYSDNLKQNLLPGIIEVINKYDIDFCHVDLEQKDFNHDYNSKIRENCYFKLPENLIMSLPTIVFISENEVEFGRTDKKVYKWLENKLS